MHQSIFVSMYIFVCEHESAYMSESIFQNAKSTCPIALASVIGRETAKHIVFGESL